MSVGSLWSGRPGRPPWLGDYTAPGRQAVKDAEGGRMLGAKRRSLTALAGRVQLKGAPAERGGPALRGGSLPPGHIIVRVWRTKYDGDGRREV